MSILAGALTDRWDKKKTMLLCDVLAAFTTFIVFVLIKTAIASVCSECFFRNESNCGS